MNFVLITLLEEKFERYAEIYKEEERENRLFLKANNEIRKINDGFEQRQREAPQNVRLITALTGI